MWRPKIKDEHWPVRYGTGLVRIGGIVPKIAKNIPDPDGWAWALLRLLDGSRTVDRIITELARSFPALTRSQVRAEVRTDLGKLAGAGFVEDAAEVASNELTDEEKERYSRGRLLWHWMDRNPRCSSWEVQLRLRQARVLVIGVGGVGGNAALSLALAGVGKLHLVDPDVVELSNLNRHFLFTERDVGLAKVEAAVERLRCRNSTIEVTGQVATVTDPLMLAALASHVDVMVMAADRPQQIVSWANQAASRTGTAWVHGGYHGPLVNIGVYRPGSGPCYDCAHLAERERRAGLPSRTVMPGKRPQGLHASSSVTAGVAGQYVALAVMSLITGVPRLRLNCEYGVNLAAPGHDEVRGLDQSRSDCPTRRTPGQPAS